MKKIIILFSLMLVLILPTIAQTNSSSQYVTNTNAEKLIDKYSEKVGNVIEALAIKLQQPAEYVYKILVKQQLVIGYTILVGMILALLILYISYKLENLIYKEDAWTDVTIPCITCIFMGLLFIGLFIAFIIRGFPSILNPEYYAIEKILELIK